VVTDPADASGAWVAFDVLVRADEIDESAVAVVREVIAGARDLVTMIDRGEDYEGDSTVLDRLRNALAGRIEP